MDSQRFDDAVTIFLKEEAQLPEDELSFLRTTPIWDQMTALAPTFVREWQAIFEFAPTVKRYQDLTMPVLLLSGTVTEDHPSFATQALQDTLPNVRKVMLDGEGHGANLTAPDLVSRKIAEFLLT